MSNAHRPQNLSGEPRHDYSETPEVSFSHGCMSLRRWTRQASTGAPLSRNPLSIAIRRPWLVPRDPQYYVTMCRSRQKAQVQLSPDIATSTTTCAFAMERSSTTSVLSRTAPYCHWLVQDHCPYLTVDALRNGSFQFRYKRRTGDEAGHSSLPDFRWISYP